MHTSNLFRANLWDSDLGIGIAPRVAVDGDEVVGPVLGGDDAGDVEQPLPGPVSEGLLGGGVPWALAARHGGALCTVDGKEHDLQR